MEKTQQRINTYWIVGTGLTLAYLFLRGVNWQGSAQLHTIMEVLATALALFVGLLALIRFYSRGGTNFLILGVGFVGVGFLDGYHALVTSSWFKTFFPSDLSSLVIWSWLASRLFLSIVVFSCFIVMKKELDQNISHILAPKTVFSLTIISILCGFLFFEFVPLPSGYFEDVFFYRPIELIPAIFFLLALIGYLKLGEWKTNEFEHWLILAIIINLIAQLVFMPYSSELFDVQFDVAHLLKKISYICVLAGLGISVFRAFKNVESEVVDRKRAQQALEASEIRNRTLMNSLVDGLITINETGIIEGFNNAACNLFGYSKLEVLGRNIKMLMPQPYHDEHDGYLLNYARTGKAHIIGLGIGRQVTGLRKDGSTFPLDLTVSEMTIGGMKKFSGIVRDDTERQRAENEIIESRNEAQVAAQVKSDFLATMSHEIRTPMNGVLGMVEILQHTPLNDYQQDIVKTISESGLSLLEIINDILDYSKVEAGKIELDYTSFNLERTVYDVARLLTVKAEEKNIELIFHYHKNCPDYVIGDAGRIRQVLLNLVGNAIKFTDHGQVVIEVMSQHQTDKDSDIRIEVRDTGVGFDENTKEKLFESFTQADGSTSRKYAGTGLGLTISKQLVELMGGSLDVESELEKGSRFWIELKLETIESPERLEKSDLDGARVLVVDDNSINRQILREQLLGWNMWVDESSNPGKVLQRMWAAQQTNKPYRLVIIDNLMPEMNGMDLGREIKANEELKDIPLVLLTSATVRGAAAVVKEIGFSAYITKPILSNLLNETLSSVLGLSVDDKNKDRFLTRHTVMEDDFDKQKKTNKLKGNILLVEDVLVNQKVVLGLMEGVGVHIDVAENGEVALEKYKRNKYDLILMDCQMPVMDGFEVTRKIRETDQDIIIIAVTANALSSDRLKCTEAGMNDYLAKPFNRQQLTSVLLRWLEGDELPVNEEESDVNESVVSENEREMLDKNKLQEMKDIMGGVFDELIPAYIEQSDEIINDMLSVLEQNNLEVLERYAHSMKSSSHNMGAQILSQLSMELEEMVRNNEGADLLKNKIELVCQAYEKVKPPLLQFHERSENDVRK